VLVESISFQKQLQPESKAFRPEIEKAIFSSKEADCSLENITPPLDADYY
jgi:hypothetical protein